MNIGISHINLIDSAAISAYSTQHLSFPASNVQHRWFVKPYRSRYGEDSGWGLFRVTAANQNIYFGEQKVLNGTMESWASATNPNNWAENLTGTSTVNQEATEKRFGSYSCRFDVDGAESAVNITQSVVLVAGGAHKISFWHNTPVGSTLAFQFVDSAANVYLASDGTWTAASTYVHATGTGAWAFFTLDFSAHASYTNYTLAVHRGDSMASKSQYVDDVAVSQRYTAALTVGDYDATTLAAEMKTRMDAAGGTYTITYSDTTNKFTIAGSQTFILYWLNITNAAWGLIGFSLSQTRDSAISTTITSTYMRIHSLEEVRYDLGAESNIYFAAVKNHNLQSTSTPQIVFWSDAFITEAEIESMTWNEAFMVVPLNQFYRYVGFRAADVDNPDTYIEIGRLWIGEWFKPRIGFSMERERVPNDPSVIAESENGQASSIQRTKFDTWNYTFEGVDPTDKDTFDAIFAEVGTSKPIMICEDPDAADLTVNTKYVTITSWEWKHIAGEWWRLELEVKEER
jgi:hypothetical protein